jgi:hypothetical protein
MDSNHLQQMVKANKFVKDEDPVIFKNDKFRLCLASLLLPPLLFTVNACTVNRAFIQPGTIPKLAVPYPGAEKFGKALIQEICIDYDIDSDNQKRNKLIGIFDQLTKAAEVDHLPWHIYLFNGPEIVDIRAVHGNYIFVWSGLFEAA